MLVIIHVLIAVSSIGYATYLLISPSKKKLNVTYGLIALTLSSGSYLVWASGAPMLQACMSGLIYLAVVSALVVYARHRLVSSDKITLKHENSSD